MMKSTEKQTAERERPKALALPKKGGFLDKAKEALYESGWYGSDHYETTSVRVGRELWPVIRSINDDREVLGDIAKELVIVSIPFRLVTAR